GGVLRRIDPECECQSQVVWGRSLVHGERSLRQPLAVRSYVEAQPCRSAFGVDEQLRLLAGGALNAKDVGDRSVAVAAVTVDVVAALLVLGDGGRSVVDDVEVNLRHGWLRQTPPVVD